ncbi:hypothetical protein EDEG_01242 [Edhazardia aedis USNM 41457]|uniref:Rhodanese domain-containing protein n=1 Tax=Edhazardia aedis (strain USNM 41457) TaxID=1003232 RepID=J9DAQ9_EDHAE|nr:hypothetical protein EDEG_01242 [Edhazardia aedis USNM 41457]|eukprot:EJW04559.1 hypothetical protein EDEG_01242 [Edhazardia aedis USNM 41457]
MLYESRLTNSEIERYSRQIILSQIGVDGQIHLRNAKVLIVGLGGLGSPVLMYLASCGIQTIGIVDYDKLELHNLQRQVIHNEEGLHTSKVESAANFARKLNSTINIVEHDMFFSSDTVDDLVSKYDVIVDCSDNIDARYQLSDFCKKYGKKMVLASVLKFEGQVFILPVDGPCYRCLFPERKLSVQNCDEAGVLGPVCGIIGSIQATEVIKMIISNDATPKLLTYDAFKSEMKTFDLSKKKNQKCPVCVRKEIPMKVFLEGTKPPKMVKCDPERKISWKQYLEKPDDFVLVDVRPKSLFNICKIKDSINISSEDFMKDYKIEVPGSDKKKILLLCKKGVTAAKVGNFLLENERTAYVLEGGLKSFKSDIDHTFPL